jgi:hypothetical protein
MYSGKIQESQVDEAKNAADDGPPGLKWREKKYIALDIFGEALMSAKSEYHAD